MRDLSRDTHSLRCCVWLTSKCSWCNFNWLARSEIGDGQNCRIIAGRRSRRKTIFILSSQNLTHDVAAYVVFDSSVNLYAFHFTLQHCDEHGLVRVEKPVQWSTIAVFLPSTFHLFDMRPNSVRPKMKRIAIATWSARGDNREIVKVVTTRWKLKFININDVVDASFISISFSLSLPLLMAMGNKRWVVHSH